MKLNTIDDLIQALASTSDGASRAGLNAAWRDGSLVAWLETRTFHTGQPDPALLERIQALAKRLSGDADLGLFALLQTLAPSRPLELAPRVLIDTPEKIDAVIAADPRRRQELMAALTKLVANGRLVEWLRACGFSNADALIARLGALPQSPVAGLELLPGYAVRWQVSNTAPFPTRDDEAASPKALAAWLDGSPDRRDLGLTLLKTGWLGLWLKSTGRLGKPGDLDALKSADLSAAARAETLLRLLDPARLPARVQSAPASLNIGRLAPEVTTEQTIVVTNTGKGHVWGTCALEGDGAGMRVEPLSFDGTPARFKLIVDTRGVPPFTAHSATVAINCYDGGHQHPLRVPVSYRVQIPLLPKIGRSLLAASVAGMVMLVLRLWAGAVLVSPGDPRRSLDWVSMDWVGKVLDQSFGSFVGVALPGFVLLGTLIGLLIYLARVCNR